MAYVPPIQTRSELRFSRTAATVLGISSFGILWATLLVTNVVTLGGIPLPVFLKFWQDPIARSAYLGENDQALHDRMTQLGIEAAIKAYYRPRIPDELALDQHVHQILYRRTGYVGDAYLLDEQGQLVLKEMVLDDRVN